MYKDMADDAVAMKIFNVIENDPNVTERSITLQTGLASGLVHSFMKRVINKGWVRAKKVSPRRWLYFLTPDGLGEKSRLTMNYFSRTFREYGNAYRQVRSRMMENINENDKNFVIAGVNELAEVSAVNVETMDGLIIVAMVSNAKALDEPTDRPVQSFSALRKLKYDRIFVCDPTFLKWWENEGHSLDDQRLILMFGEIRV